MKRKIVQWKIPSGMSVATDQIIAEHMNKALEEARKTVRDEDEKQSKLKVPDWYFNERF